MAQVTFFLQHTPLVLGLMALPSLPAIRSSRVARVGIVAGTVGMILLAVMELVDLSAATVATDGGSAELVSALYGVPVILTGVGLIVGGAPLLRTDPGSWTGTPWLRAVPFLLGVWVFVPLLPAIMGPLIAGRLAIGSWMLLFAALGWGLARLPVPERP